MNKKIQLTIYSCLIASIWAAHYFNPAKEMGITPASGLHIQPVYHSSTTINLASSLNKPASIPTIPATSNSINLNGSNQIIYTGSALDDNDQAELEKHRLLRNLRAWAEKDPEAALAATMKLPVGDERNQALSAVCLGMAEVDPAAAVKLAQTLNLDKQPGALMANLVQKWADTDLASALDWANSQPASFQRDGFATRIAYVMSQSNPIDAENLVINQISPGTIQDEALMMVLNQWAHQNLAAAATWVKGFPAGPLQARAVNELEGIANYKPALNRQ